MRHLFPFDIDIGILRNQRSEIERRRQICVRIKSFRDVSFLFHVGKRGRRFVEADGNLSEHLVAVYISNVQIGRRNRDGRVGCIGRYGIIIPAELSFGGRIVRIHLLSAYGDVRRGVGIGRSALEGKREAPKRKVSDFAAVLPCLYGLIYPAEARVGGFGSEIRIKRSRISIKRPICTAEYLSQLCKHHAFAELQLQARDFSRNRHGNVKRIVKELAVCK